MADRDSEEESGFAISEDFVQSPTHRAALTGTIHLDGLLRPGLVLHEDVAGGNGGQAWPVLSLLDVLSRVEDLKLSFD